MTISHRLTITVLIPVAVLLRLLHSVSAAGDPSFKTLFEYYPARAAAFGAYIPNNEKFNLMLPPVKSNFSLCEYPSSLFNVSDDNPETDLPKDDIDVPIAILVRKDCSVVRQARNAVELQENAVTNLRYLIIEGLPEDAVDAGFFPKMLNPDTEDQNTLDLLKSIGILSITFKAAASMRTEIRRIDERRGGEASPFLFSEGNHIWAMIGQINPYSSSNTRGSMDDGSGDSFYWFRILLFVLLLISPCCRAAYLWWTGGGRFHLVRNPESGRWRIQYVPPMSYWLSHGMLAGARPPNAPTTNTITDEEFNALPEIEYKPLDASEEQNEGNMETTDIEQQQPPPASPGRSKLEPSAPHADPSSNTAPRVSEGGETTAVPLDSLASPPPEQSPQNQSTAMTTRNCTMCSICIDDFVVGEKLVILPLCGHCFHRDCIHPWVTERQGCCPLCKTNVLESTEDDMERQNTQDSEVEESSEPNSSSSSTVANPVQPSQTADGIANDQTENESEARRRQSGVQGT